VGTARYGLRPAPEGLALVQDFLNTRASEVGGPDLLRDTAGVDDWGAHAVRAWSRVRGVATEPPVMTDHDAAMLRSVRDTLDGTLAGTHTENVHPLIAAAEYTIAGTGTGEMSWMPRGHGWHWYAGAFLGEILLSQQTKTWQRFRQCRNVGCRAAMYDGSWDNGAVWHNRRTCDPSFGAAPRR
jgi:hypothetical protein